MISLALLLAAAQADPVSAARAAEQAGRFAEAEKHYEAALAAKPTAELWQRLGIVRHLQNQFSRAIPAFEKALAADPKLWGSHLLVGICLYKTNRFAGALPHLESADRLAPRHPEVLFWLGATRLALGKNLAGLEALERRLQLTPGDAEVLGLLSTAYCEYGAALWSDVAENHFETAAGQVVHGHALESDGDWRGAMAAYRRALELEPGRPGVSEALERVKAHLPAAREAP